MHAYLAMCSWMPAVTYPHHGALKRARRQQRSSSASARSLCSYSYSRHVINFINATCTCVNRKFSPSCRLWLGKTCSVQCKRSHNLAKHGSVTSDLDAAMFFGGIDLYSDHWVTSRILVLARLPRTIISVSFTKSTMVNY